MTDQPAAHALSPHPGTPCAAVQRLEVTLANAASGQAWHLRYELTGDLDRLRVPPASGQPSPKDGLWRHTCFEVFVGSAGSAAYREFNFSPSGDWAAYAFSVPRVRDAAAEPLPAPRLACTRAPRRLTLEAWLPWSALPPPGDGGALVGLSAVIETLDGGLAYWALRHPAARPDFHDRAGWTARGPHPHPLTP
jgi:hypothetical protein